MTKEKILKKVTPIKHKFILFHHKLNYILLLGLALVLFIGSIIHFVEDGSPQENIHTIGDGLWWAFSTITAVGYGDKYPVTTLGRIIGVILMTIGITIYSLLTANIASYFVEEDEEKEYMEIKNKITNLEKKIDQLLDSK
jgi:voltage-gated potassium channel